MVDIQATSEIVKWTINIITIILMIIAISLAIKKKNNFCFAVALIGNLVVYYFTESPLLCWIVSIACIIWASLTKNKGESENQQTTSKNKKSKVGNIIGIIIGIGFVAGPLIAYLNQEASISDPTTQGILILFAVIGAFMIMNNIFKLFENENVSVSTSTQTIVSKVVTVQAPSKAEAKSEDDSDSKSDSNSSKKIRCRFCKKLYSSEYNGCPYCKKK